MFLLLASINAPASLRLTCTCNRKPHVLAHRSIAVHGRRSIHDSREPLLTESVISFSKACKVSVQQRSVAFEDGSGMWPLQWPIAGTQAWR